MKRPEPLAAGELSIDDLPDVLTLAEAAEAVRVSKDTIRAAIKSGALAGFIPRGKDPLRAGPRLGYRVHKADLQRWFFGETPR